MEIQKGSSNGQWDLYEDISQTKDQIIAKATMVNCTAEFADEYTIQLDLDTPASEVRFNEAWPWFNDQLELYEAGYPEHLVSKSGKCHVVIRTKKPIPAVERIAIQAILGSDLRRELLNLTRLKVNGDDLTCLFRPKPKLLTAGE